MQVAAKVCCEASFLPGTANPMKREAKGNAQGKSTSCCIPSIPTAPSEPAALGTWGRQVSAAE